MWAWLGFHIITESRNNIISFKRNSPANLLGFGKSHILDECPEGANVLRVFQHPSIPRLLAPGCSIPKPVWFIWPQFLETFFPSMPINALSEKCPGALSTGGALIIRALWAGAFQLRNGYLCEKLGYRRALVADHKHSVPCFRLSESAIKSEGREMFV